MPEANIPQFVHDDLAKLGIELPEELLTQLAAYLDLLLEVNKRTNLTAIRERDAAWRRLIIDSLTVLPGLDNLDEGATVIDVGSGGGMPGIPIAIARPDLKVTLLEATGKKAKFLQQAVDTLGLRNVNVLNERAEIVGQSPKHRQHYDAAVNRAVGRMTEVLEYCMPLLRVGGQMLTMKGKQVEDELDAAGDALTLLGAGEINIFDAYPEGFDLELVVVVITKAHPTPDDYPRRPGLPRHEPL